MLRNRSNESNSSYETSVREDAPNQSAFLQLYTYINELLATEQGRRAIEEYRNQLGAPVGFGANAGPPAKGQFKWGLGFSSTSAMMYEAARCSSYVNLFQLAAHYTNPDIVRAFFSESPYASALLPSYAEHFQIDSMVDTIDNTLIRYRRRGEATEAIRQLGEYISQNASVRQPYFRPVGI